MRRIAHISDLHFGAVSPRAAAALADDLHSRKPDLIVVTGDLTQGGRRKEFESAYGFLEALPAKRLVIPGNHDVPVRDLWARFTAPYDRFKRYLNAPVDPVHTDEVISIVGLNSARRAAFDINWSYGRLSKSQIRKTADALRRAPERTLKAVAVHHPFVRGPGRAGARTVGRADEALSAFVSCGLDLVMTGHVHQSSADMLNVNGRSIVIIQAGTATSMRTRLEAPAYNLIDASLNEIRVRVASYDGVRFNVGDAAPFRKHDHSGWRAA